MIEKKKWQTLSSKEIFAHPRLTLIEDEVLLPNGNKTDYLKYKETHDGATLICRQADGKILVSLEYSYPPDDCLFQFPGGAVPKDEKIETGANRELMEEVNLRAEKLELLGSYLLENRRSNSKMYVFLATDLKEESLEGDPEEDIESFWFSEEEIGGMIKEGKIINAHALASWSVYIAHKLSV